jgi:hypothetical protein
VLLCGVMEAVEEEACRRCWRGRGRYDVGEDRRLFFARGFGGEEKQSLIATHELNS